MRGRLKTSLARWPVSATPIVAAVAGLVGGAAGWTSRLVPPVLGAGLLAGGGALLIQALRDLSNAERLARSMEAGPRASRRSLASSLKGVAAQMGAVRHRLGAAHPISGAPMREHLLRAMERSRATTPPRGVLGVVRLVDFDLIARFDRVRAHASLRRFADSLTGQASPHRSIGQIDRDCFGVWFADLGDAEEARTRLLDMVRQAVGCIADAGLIISARTKAAVLPAEAARGREGDVIASALSLLADGPRPAGVVEAQPAHLSVAREAFNLEQDVATAMAQARLATVFQPVVDLASRRVVGAEALLRWEHPLLGAISPDRFVPMIEARGLGEAMGRHVLAAACAEAASWRALGLGQLTVAVNMGPQQLLDPELPGFVRKLLDQHRLEPAALELELTETVAMADPARTKAAFHALRAVGVALSADDFGKGFSSLSYLKNLPFDKLKIDREFVAGLDQRSDSRAICRALVTLGAELGLAVLAEGVETKAEADALLEIGCFLVQGYYFSGPLSREDFPQFAASGAV